MRVGATVLLWSVAILILTMLILFYGSFVAADELARMEVIIRVQSCSFRLRD